MQCILQRTTVEYGKVKHANTGTEQVKVQNNAGGAVRAAAGR